MKKIGKYTPRTWAEYIRIFIALSSVGYLGGSIRSAVVQSYWYISGRTFVSNGRRIMRVDVCCLTNSTTCYPGYAWRVVWFRLRHLL